MGLLEKIAPEIALRRAYSKKLLSAMSASAEGGFTAGSKKRSVFKNWFVSKRDADSDITADIETMRARSVDLEKNNPIASAALNTKARFVVGTGLVPEPRIDTAALGVSAEAAEILNAEIKREFDLWADDPRCDWREEKNFYQKQQEVYFTKECEGDAWTFLPYDDEDPDFPLGVRINTVSPARIANPTGEKDSDTLKNGVIYDNRGRKSAVWVADKNPASGKRLTKSEFKKVTRRRENGWLNFLHWPNKALRAGQSRGVPALAPVMQGLRQLGEYIDAEILGSLIATKFTVFIKSQAGNASSGLMPGGAMNQSGASDESGSSNQTPLELGDGLVVDLAENEDVTIADPQRPNPNLGPFIESLSITIGAALAMPLEILRMHFSASYSASKAALLMFYHTVVIERAELVRHFCRPVYEQVIDDAVMSGRLQLPGYFASPARRAAYLQCAWHGQPIGDIDEYKAAAAAEKRLNNNISNELIEVRKLGHDPEKVYTRRVAEIRRKEADGLVTQESKPAEHMPPTNEE